MTRDVVNQRLEGVAKTTVTTWSHDRFQSWIRLEALSPLLVSPWRDVLRTV